jgi:hypothetical protein
MPVELDHCILFASAGAPEADRLIEFGLTEGSANTHPGQGTANRRFFFQNAYLELLWVDDPAEAQSERVRRMGLWERWSRRASGVCPLGVGFRPAAGGGTAPFPAWEYRPSYLPDPLAIYMATNSDVVTEPLLFYLAFSRRPDPNDLVRRQPREHAAGVQEITRVRVSVGQGGAASAELRAAEEACNGLSFVSANENLLEVGFDGEKGGQSADFRPALPLVFRW